MSEWHDIATAPKDGTVIEVCALDDDTEGPFRMRWESNRVNMMVGTHAGMWACPFGNFTWDESRGFGPTHWRHVIRSVK